MRRSSEPVWPHRSDFVDCDLPRTTLAQELALGRAILSDERSANSIASLLAMSEHCECPPPESALFLTEDDVEYIGLREVS